MTKLDIIVNQALENQIINIMPQHDGKPCYTKLNQVDGVGSSGYCLGNNVWPEENVMFILYVSQEEANQIKVHIAEIRKKFPLLGLAAFELQSIDAI
jgi:hypothetical protein